MPTDHRATLAGRSVRFPSLINYLRDELDWPIISDDFEESDLRLHAEELGIDRSQRREDSGDQAPAAPFEPNQPWGIFFIKFEPKRLPSSLCGAS